MNKPIVLYRYHNNFQLVKERIKLIKLLDPGIEVYGIFGGKKDDYPEASNVLEKELANNYLIPVEDGTWKWLHADLTYKYWFNDVGCNIDFDYVYVLEWDLLIMDHLKSIFAYANKNRVIFTGLIPIEKIARFWFWTDKNNQPKIEAFYNKVEKKFNLPFNKYACLGPGLAAPRKLFEGLVKLDLFESFISDEIKLPVWSQILGLEVVSNNFYKKWFSYYSMRFFNANVANIPIETVEKQMQKKNGQRAFHPFREDIKAEQLFDIFNKRTKKSKSPTKPYNTKSINPLSYKIHCKLMDNNFFNK